MIFVLLMLFGLAILACVHFFFEETLAPERRLKLNFKQVLSLYSAIIQDSSFRKPMLAGCFSSAVLFCYITSSSAILMDHFHLSEQVFAYVFGANAVGIMLFSTLNKRLANRLNILHRLRIGTTLQLSGVIGLLVLGLMGTESLMLVLIGMFMVVASIGFTGPNAMAIAMSEQGARAGTASAIMGSMQFGCGLLGGILLNFMGWTALLNMALVMAIFVGIAASTIYRLQLPLPKAD